MTTPAPVKKAMENAVVRSIYYQLAVTVNTSLIRRSDERYKPCAIQAARAKVN